MGVLSVGSGFQIFVPMLACRYYDLNIYGMTYLMNIEGMRSVLDTADGLWL
jgi:hypothetical protein